MEDSIIRINVSKQIAQLELTYESDRQKSQIQQLTIDKLTQNKNYLIFILVFSQLCIGFIFWLNYRLKVSNKNLLGKNKEISEAHLKGQTIERRRVAMDLHDNLGSTLSALWMNVDMIDKSKMNVKEKDIHQNLRINLEKAYNDVRLLSHNLLPEEFEKQGVTLTLQTFVRKMNKNSAINFELKMDQDFGRVNNMIEFELYSICLELVNNIIKHSKATEAKIELTRTEKHIKLIISDNGIGTFDNQVDGNGMKNAKARVTSINGVLDTQTSENEGTRHEINVGIRS